MARERVQLGVQPEGLEQRRNGLEGVDRRARHLCPHRHREEPDVGAHVEHAGAGRDRDAVTQVGGPLEHLPVEEAGLGPVPLDHHHPVGEIERRPALRQAGLLHSQLLAHGVGVLQARHEVGHEPPVPRSVLAGHHRGFLHPGMLGQRGLDLARLDAVATDLHLMVDAAQELEHAVGQPASEVAGPVHPGTRLGAERIRDEPLGGEVGPVQVAAAHLDPADVKLPRDSHRHRLPARDRARTPGCWPPAARWGRCHGSPPARRASRSRRPRPRSVRRGCPVGRPAARRSAAAARTAAPRRSRSPDAASGSATRPAPPGRPGASRARSGAP